MTVISILMAMAMLADAGRPKAQANGQAVAGCPATYKAVKALLRGPPQIVQGGREPGDKYAIFTEYKHARPQVLGTTATSILIHTPKDGDAREVGRVVIRLPGQSRDIYLPAFVSVYGEEAADGLAHPDSNDEDGSLNEVELDQHSGPFAVLKPGGAHLVCEYNY